jgi:plasmid stability protein
VLEFGLAVCYQLLAMTSVLVRNVDPALHARLKARAEAHHRSLEEEVRVLLQAGVVRQEPGGKPDLVALAGELFGRGKGVELELPSRSGALDRPPPDFSRD